MLDQIIPYAGIQGGGVMPTLDGPSGNFGDVASLLKAIQAGYSTDVATYTGGEALRLQSIEPTLQYTIEQDKHFVFFNKVAVGPSGATVFEWTTKDEIGGVPGSAFNTQLGDIQQSQGKYSRHVLRMKYLMTMREVSQVHITQTRTLADAIALEKIDATRELKRTVEYGCFYGDDTVQEIEFNGLMREIEIANDPDLIIDAGGAGLSNMGHEIITIARVINSRGHFGTATDIYCSNAVQGDEFDEKLDPHVRVKITAEDTKIGTPVIGLRTSWGDIKNNPDIYIEEGLPPFETMSGNYAAWATLGGSSIPGGFTASAGSSATSKFGASHAGNYYWGVAALTRSGRTPIVKTTSTAVSAGQGVTLTITNSVDTNVTGYVLYRSRKNGTNASSDFREFRRIGRQAGASTVFLDDNLYIPGTSHVFVVNHKPGDDAIRLRRLGQMMLFPLYPTIRASKPWAQLFFCGLQVTKPKQHGMIRNVLPANAKWRPF